MALPKVLEKIRKMAGGSFTVPDAVWYDERLKPVEVKVYKVFLDYSLEVLGFKVKETDKDNTPFVTVSQKTLAKKANVSEKTFQRCAEKLEELALIDIVRERDGYKQKNKYKLVTTYYVGKAKPKAVETPKAEPAKKEELPMEKTSQTTLDAMRMRYLKKLRSINGVTYWERLIFDISKHYNMLMSEAKNVAGYRSLPKKNWKEHKNWTQFEKLYELCRENQWDVFLYLEAQFERAEKYWTNGKFKQPLPNMLRSEKAQTFFVRWYDEREEKYAMDMKNKRGAKKTMTKKERYMRDVVRSAEALAMYVNGENETERAESKAVRLFHAWEAYSPAYLYTIPWFHEYLDEFLEDTPDHKKALRYKAEINLIKKSKTLHSVVMKAVERSEEAYEIPHNIVI